ncbi:helix-turn-helix domain-containing protein [Companilactobacillus kimchiensis]|uniref:HTH cro/C1-type domain-containing protein n=1 Tax=Companilactobacillus kimchiensis TaxID=993692 RepID=A0A0R2LFV0_9LACO|nr:helix-turn-helix transcriptional regulator [Companilactobacillus kimchiensis]KRO00757.1 hypothetical protein IV57_GL000077 [Companilactobacillus kimchiensis]
MAKRFEFIRDKRTDMGLTIEQLAKKSNVSVDLISRLERGNRDDITISRLESILTVLGLKLGDIFEHSELDERGNQFVKEFFSLNDQERKRYTDIFLKIMSLK